MYTTGEKLKKFKILGTFFCQQNNHTSVCAHASLCMTINNMDGLFITSEDINKILGIDHKTTKVGHGIGLDADNIQSVLGKYGLSFHYKNFFDEPNIMYNDYIYRYIESRCPVLLVFTTNLVNEPAHVVTIIGHTLNSDMWRPEAEQVYTSKTSIIDSNKPASAWIDHFIIHDDNFGMYSCLPVEALKRITLPLHDPRFRALYAISVIPSGVLTTGWEAEIGNIYVIKSLLATLSKQGVLLDQWTKRIYDLIASTPPRPTVVRTLLVEKDNYVRDLDGYDFDGNKYSDSDKLELSKNLPARFWMTEISLPDLYTANKSKIIDVFYVCDQPLLKSFQDFDKRWIQVRFPNALHVNQQGALPITLNVNSHYPLFRQKSCGEYLEW